MNRNYVFTDVSQALPVLLNRLLNDGEEVGSRNGRTMELPFTGITLTEPLNRELLLQVRKHHLAAQIAETMWVLTGRDDVEWLSRYLPRAVDYSDDGKVWRGGYGPRIRKWGPDEDSRYEQVDQLQYVVDTLRAAPSSRQAVISIWNPIIDTLPGKDLPCNDIIQFLSRNGKLDAHVFIRSNDVMWGWSNINSFEWSTLLEIVAGMVGLNVGSLHFSVSSFHLYDIHWEKARDIVGNSSVYPEVWSPSPRFNTTGLDDIAALDYLMDHWMHCEKTIRRNPSSPQISAIIDDFPEPMLQSWLRVIAWWWSGSYTYLEPLKGTDLYASAVLAVQPKRESGVPTLIDKVVALHIEKDAAYRGSWCKRGEVLGILANIARKVDRLGGAATSDETRMDTAIDTYVYCAKYLAWVHNGEKDDLEKSNEVLRLFAVPNFVAVDNATLEETLRQGLSYLEGIVIVGKDIPDAKEDVIETMLNAAWSLVSNLDRE